MTEPALDALQPPDHELPAGVFSTWLAGIEGAIAGDGESDVPCDGCTACCTSSQFVHIGPDETDALSHISPELLFPAPMMPAGNVLMGYDKRGNCPMLVRGSCSIYDHRPRTCRTYDCRVFPAAGVGLDDDNLVSLRARRWRFDYPSAADLDAHAGVRAAAEHLGAHGDDEGRIPSTTTQLAVAAIQRHQRFEGLL